MGSSSTKIRRSSTFSLIAGCVVKHAPAGAFMGTLERSRVRIDCQRAAALMTACCCRVLPLAIQRMVIVNAPLLVGGGDAGWSAVAVKRTGASDPTSAWTSLLPALGPSVQAPALAMP